MPYDMDWIRRVRAAKNNPLNTNPRAKVKKEIADSGPSPKRPIGKPTGVRGDPKRPTGLRMLHEREPRYKPEPGKKLRERKLRPKLRRTSR